MPLDSDTGQQASWQSISPSEANRISGGTNILTEAESALQNGTGEALSSDSGSAIFKTTRQAPIAVSDPTVSIGGDTSFDEDTSAADYFTYDEGHRSNGRRRDKVIRRPRLSPACESFLVFVMIFLDVRLTP